MPTIPIDTDKRILVIGKEGTLRLLIEEILSTSGYRVALASSCREGGLATCDAAAKLDSD